MKILGISCYYHDSAASIIIDNEIVACCQEDEGSYFTSVNRKIDSDSFERAW